MQATWYDEWVASVWNFGLPHYWYADSNCQTFSLALARATTPFQESWCSTHQCHCAVQRSPPPPTCLLHGHKPTSNFYYGVSLSLLSGKSTYWCHCYSQLPLLFGPSDSIPNSMLVINCLLTTIPPWQHPARASQPSSILNITILSPFQQVHPILVVPLKNWCNPFTWGLLSCNEFVASWYGVRYNLDELIQKHFPMDFCIWLVTATPLIP